MKPFVEWLALLCTLGCLWTSAAQAQPARSPCFHVLNPSSSLNTCSTAYVHSSVGIRISNNTVANYYRPSMHNPFN